MDDTKAQLISLISYGNQYITTGKHIIDYYPQHSVFRYCSEVTFETYRKSIFNLPKKLNIANNPAEWFRFLKESDCRELRLFYQHSSDQKEFRDYQTAGLIGGGGHWFIEAVYKKNSDFWQARWDVQDNNTEQRWKVAYEAVAREKPSLNLQFTLYHAKENLYRSLKDIGDFAYKHDLDFWGDWFKKAITTLDSETPSADFYHPELILTKHYTLPAQQLIFGALKSWVFGAMGSWNDQGFTDKEEQEKYEKLTETLYKAVAIALIAGINTY